MNNSETYFELDSEEATHCHHCHLISCVYIKGLVNTKDQSNACMCENDVKGVERSLNSFNCYSCYSSRKSRKWCLWLLHNTAYRVLLFLLLLMSKGSKVSNTMYCTLYTGPLAPARREGYLDLPSWGFSSSPLVSLRRQLCSLSWTCQTTRLIAGKMHNQSLILKTKGALSDPVILTYLWEQSCILHTLNKLPA